MKFCLLASLFFLIFSQKQDCDTLQITTTPDNPGNVVKNGKYNPNWSQAPYASFANSDKIRFFISGLDNTTVLTLSHKDESKAIEDKWIYTELNRNSENYEKYKYWELEVVQECLPRDSWQSIDMVLEFQDCLLDVKWPKNCGNMNRVLSSFNLGFAPNSSELIRNGIVITEFNSVNSGEISKQQFPPEVYFWSSHIEPVLAILNTTYTIRNSSGVIEAYKNQLRPFENNTQVISIPYTCTTPGLKTVFLYLSLIHLQTYTISFSFTCEAPKSSTFKTFILVIIFLFILFLLAILFLRVKDQLVPTQFLSFFNVGGKKDYSPGKEFPDKEFPDVQFSDLTFRTDSRAYGTV